ncbi:MAG: sulfatase [Sedimentisphaerales bacterium]|nr:sulfatase [Sedimentisphaerales bacterium]
MKQNRHTNCSIKASFRIMDMLCFVIWFGVLSALAGIAFLHVKGFIGGATVYLRCHTLWMAPTVNVAILGIVGLVTLPVVMRLSRPMALRVTCVVLGSVGFLSILCLESGRTFSRIHFIPKVILAVGLAIALQSLIARCALGFEKFVRHTTIGLILLVLVLTAIVGSRQYFDERENITGLPDPPESAPNVLLIVLDTVRAQSMSLYGYERATTPFLSSLAEQGTVFQWAIAPCSHTLPTHATLFTGRFQYETGANWSTPLSPKYPTLAEVLSSHGYATAGFVANTNVCTTLSGLARGFGRFEDQITFVGKFFNSSPLIRFALKQNWIRKLIGYRDLLGRKRVDRITDDFLRWFDRIPGGHPFFAFLNYYDAHQPYLPPEEFDGMFGPTDLLGTYLGRYNHGVPCSGDNTSPEETQALHNSYDASIAYLDSGLKRLFEELKRRDLMERTFVILVSDHGEEFGEHSVFGHGTDLHIQSIHVPLLLRYPASVPVGVVVNKPVSLRDVPATTVEILGLDDAGAFPGQSLSRHWTGTDHNLSEPGESMLSELIYAPWDPEWAPVSKGDMKSLVTGEIHYIRNGDGTEEVYNLREDPMEHNNLIQTPRGAEAAAKARHIIEGNLY